MGVAAEPLVFYLKLVMNCWHVHSPPSWTAPDGSSDLSWGRFQPHSPFPSFSRPCTTLSSQPKPGWPSTFRLCAWGPPLPRGSSILGSFIHSFIHSFIPRPFPSASRAWAHMGAWLIDGCETKASRPGNGAGWQRRPVHRAHVRCGTSPAA